ncbi:MULTISPECIES: hypothetical protein [unclassified Mycobacterium]|uniref:hypothetical protein n=1 Tax=unclassified Mycobacterium TaxID=2642494 RepID=UPI000991CDD4|nr:MULTISPECIES: hypothetical protein [unclassified Mycobacterium]
MDLAVDIVLLPYTVAAELVGRGADLWLLNTLAVWVLGSILYTMVFVVMGVAVDWATRGFDAVAERLWMIADRGADLEQRRRNAGWLTRVMSRTAAIRARGPVETEGLMGEGDFTVLLESAHSNLWARRVIRVLDVFREFRVFAPAVLFTTGGGLGLIAALWTVHPDTLRSVAHWALYDFNASTAPIAFWTLLFTMVTFAIKDVVGWKRRGLASWRTQHVSDAYDTLARVRALAYEILGLEISAIQSWADIASRAAPAGPHSVCAGATDEAESPDPYGLRAGAITAGDRMTDPAMIAEELSRLVSIGEQIDEKLTAIRVEATASDTRGVLPRCAPRSSRRLLSTLTDNKRSFHIDAFGQQSINKLESLRGKDDRDGYARKVHELTGEALLRQERLAHIIDGIDRALYPETWFALIMAKFRG